MKIILVLAFSFVIIKSDEDTKILEIEDGKILGVLEKTDTGRQYYAFKEIPYAKPPIGDLRFREPLPSEKWTGVLNTTRDTKICMQKKPAHEPQITDPRENEDCLFVNVFTPNILFNKNDELLPVYVYIFGGMFISGDPAEYNLQGFIDEEIIVVIISFRLATLGCLSTDDGVIPGNLWLKDQILALKWIQNNIKHFGGDNAKVTIGGHSSGACSVGIHVLSPKSKGLFRGAIIQSGSALISVYTLNVTEASYAYAEAFDPDIRSKSTHELLKLLRTIPANIISKTNFKKTPDFLKYALMNSRPTWGPSIENSKFENAAISGPLHDNAEKGNSNHVPLLIGITNEEFISMASMVNLSIYYSKIDEDLSKMFDVTLDIKQENRLKAALEIKDIYTQTKTFQENSTGLIKLVSDTLFNIPTTTQAYLHSKFADVFFYQFSYKGPLNGLKYYKKSPFYKVKGIGEAEHCSELPLLYYYRLDPTVTPTEEDLLMRKRLIKLWSNFIKDKNPTPRKDPLFQNITWPKMTRTDFKYLDISTNMSIKTNLDRFEEWQRIRDKYFEHPIYVY